LGELVERIGGMPVDRFAEERVFKPLKMADTGFKPAASLQARIAPTGKRNGRIILGEVHDPRAFAMGGVAGHAGLFAPADDLVRYCRMMLRMGELDGVRILKPETVKFFTASHEVLPEKLPKLPRNFFRSYGWDVDTAYSGQRGSVFPAGEGYGHTGFTGTSIWIDPKSQIAVIILTNRVHPADKGSVIRIRREVADAAAALVK